MYNAPKPRDDFVTHRPNRNNSSPRLYAHKFRQCSYNPRKVLDSQVYMCKLHIYIVIGSGRMSKEEKKREVEVRPRNWLVPVILLTLREWELLRIRAHGTDGGLSGSRL